MGQFLPDVRQVFKQIRVNKNRLLEELEKDKILKGECTIPSEKKNKGNIKK